MDLTTAQYLVSPAGAAPIATAVSFVQDRVTAVTALSRLRETCTAEQARAAWELALIRHRAVAKLGEDATRLFFDRESYEMSSGLATSTYRAQRMARSGCRRVVDLCAGVGLDTLALLRAGLSVTSIEKDPARAVFLEANCRALGLSQNVAVRNGDCQDTDITGHDTAFFDPARRTDTRRWASSLENLEPPLSFLSRIAEQGCARTCVKLSPAVDRNVTVQYAGELEIVSDRGECKEALLWTGDLGDLAQIRATLLPGERTVTGQPNIFPILKWDVAQYLYEPDPAVIRAGLIPVIAQSIGGWQVDPAVAFVFADRQLNSPFATAFEIVEDLPYKPKVLQEALRRHNTGRLVVKTRAFPESVEQVARQFKLTGTDETTLIVTRLSGVAHAFIVERTPRMDQVELRA